MARRRRTFVFPLDADGTIFLRARLDTEAGRVRGFGLQLEIEAANERHPALRFDTSHGYVHRHVFDADGTEQRDRLEFPSWDEAYTYAYEYIKRNWKAHAARYRTRKR